MVITHENNVRFHPVAYLARAGVGRRIDRIENGTRPFLPRETRQTPCSIFRAAGQNLLWFRRGQGSYHHASLRRRLRWRGVPARCLDCAWPQPLRSIPARRSRSAGKR